MWLNITNTEAKIQKEYSFKDHGLAREIDKSAVKKKALSEMNYKSVHFYLKHLYNIVSLYIYRGFRLIFVNSH